MTPSGWVSERAESATGGAELLRWICPGWANLTPLGDVKNLEKNLHPNLGQIWVQNRPNTE